MTRGQTIVREARGLYSQFNRLQAPPGALLVADNCVIDRPAIIEKRRGFRRYGQALENPASALLKYQRRLQVLDGTTLKRDSDGAGTWVAYPGIFSSPDSTVRMEGAEIQQSLYFTSSDGPQKLDSLTGTPMRTGVPPGLDLQLSLVGTGGTASWLPVANVAGYRLVWLRIDANGQEVLGEPTFREVASNKKVSSLAWTRSGSGPWTITVTHTAHSFAVSDTVEIADGASQVNGPQTVLTTPTADSYTFSVTADPGASGTLSDGKRANVQVRSTIPQGISVGDYFEVYRTITTPNSIVLDDRHLLVLRVQVTAADIALGYISFLDSKNSLGTDLYTNPLRETINRANARPPWAKHIALFKGHVFYAHTLQPQAKKIQFLDVAGLQDNTDSITIGGRTYLFSTTEDIPGLKFKRFTAETTLAENIRKTAQSLCLVLNRDPGNSSLYARYVSGPDDDPGFIRFEARTVNTAPFTITCNATATGDNFSPLLPISGSSVVSSNDQKLNGLYRSKFEKPEAVPLVNVDPIGRANQAILGLRALKDALLIYKQDGLYLLTGESDGANGASFVINELDPKLVLLVPSSLVTLDNAVWGWTSQGIVRATEAGAKIMSFPIEFDLNRIAQFDGFSALTHAIDYESDRKLLVFSQEDSANTKTKVAWCYNYITEAWTRWKKNVSTGIVLDLAGGGDRLYLTHNTDPYILEERKTYQGSDDDYQDEDLVVSVTAVGTSTDSTGLVVTTVAVNYSYAGENLVPGFRFAQLITQGIIKNVVDQGAGSFLCTLDRNITVIQGPATVSIPIKMHVEWMPDAAGNAGTMKQFSEAQIYFDRDGGTHQIGFCADTQLGAEYSEEFRVVRTWGWGASPWGESPWGDAQPSPSNPIRTNVPRQHQRCRALRVIYRNSTAKEQIRILQLTLSIGESSERTMREPR